MPPSRNAADKLKTLTLRQDNVIDMLALFSSAVSRSTGRADHPNPTQPNITQPHPPPPPTTLFPCHFLRLLQTDLFPFFILLFLRNFFFLSQPPSPLAPPPLPSPPLRSPLSALPFLCFPFFVSVSFGRFNHRPDHRRNPLRGLQAQPHGCDDDTPAVHSSPRRFRQGHGPQQRQDGERRR